MTVNAVAGPTDWFGALTPSTEVGAQEVQNQAGRNVAGKLLVHLSLDVLVLGRCVFVCHLATDIRREERVVLP